MTDEISSWLSNISHGTEKSVVMSAGKGYSFNCDGTAHYLYQNDVTRREPNGRYKRVYAGKVDGHGIEYKKDRKSHPCKSTFERWQSRHVKCGIRTN